MSQNDGMVPDDVLERLKKQIEWMKTECVEALDKLSQAASHEVLSARLKEATQINADLMSLGQLVDWQIALRQAKKAKQEAVLQ